MANLPATLLQAFQYLLDRYGPQGWWPGESDLEVVVGAILTQNTNWKNVEQALRQLCDAGVMRLPALHDLPLEELAELIRPAGYYRIKAQRLRNLTDLVMRDHQGDLAELLSLELTQLREKLLSVRGIGPETADSIILYAAHIPVFVVDTYTARVMKRHAWIEPEADYAGLQECFHDALPQEADLFNEYHALLVRVGKEHCRSQPQCHGCPLESLLPVSGPEQV
jgi:endonuclease-3 related protein